jgi:predicted CoA-binding protein
MELLTQFVLMKKTIVLGASDNPERYSYLAIQKLRRYGHPVVAIGKKEAMVGDTKISTAPSEEKEVDTVTLYLNPQLQKAYYEYILSLKPHRLIFNPGTENEELFDLAKANNIEPIEACTLVLLGTGQY